MSIFSLLSQKPWMPDQAAIDNTHIGRSSSHPLPKIALYVLMAVIGVLFSFIILTIEISSQFFKSWKKLCSQIIWSKNQNEKNKPEKVVLELLFFGH